MNSARETVLGRIRDALALAPTPAVVVPRDYRTGRKAAKVGIPAAAGVGALAGGTAAAVALHRRRR